MRIVLLPGLDGTGLLFSRLVSALGSRFEAIIVRYPKNQALNYAEHEDIARLSIPSSEPYILLGESFSGPIAISIAASNPPGLAGVILCCTFARNPFTLYARFKSLLGWVPFNRIPTLFRNPLIFGRFTSRSLRAEHQAAVSQVSNDTLRARIKAIFEVDVSTKLQQIRIPILYLRALQDRVIPQSAFQHIRQIAPRVRIAELEGPHLLLQTQPAEAATRVAEFAQELTVA